jgi:hypothetical protein
VCERQQILSLSFPSPPPVPIRLSVSAILLNFGQVHRCITDNLAAGTVLHIPVALVECYVVPEFIVLRNMVPLLIQSLPFIIT